LILLFIFFSAAKHKAVVTSAFGFFIIAISNPGDFLVKYPIVNVGLFGVEIFIEGCPDDTIRIDSYSELLSDI
jgi:hypothetical protein